MPFRTPALSRLAAELRYAWNDHRTVITCACAAVAIGASAAGGYAVAGLTAAPVSAVSVAATSDAAASASPQAQAGGANTVRAAKEAADAPSCC